VKGSSHRIVGVDLDNTIICYDLAFYRAALDLDWVDATTPKSKLAVKRAVLEGLTNREWTELQGFVYGPGLELATPYPGALAFFESCAERGIGTRIISHKTRFAVEGPAYDLREGARRWLDRLGFFESGKGLASADHLVFADTRAAKVDTLGELGCDLMIDDLPEVFLEPSFPHATDFILFDPDGSHPDWTSSPRADGWADIRRQVLP